MRPIGRVDLCDLDLWLFAGPRIGPQATIYPWDDSQVGLTSERTWERLLRFDPNCHFGRRLMTLTAILAGD
jgi:hypothetical protein